MVQLVAFVGADRDVHDANSYIQITAEDKSSAKSYLRSANMPKPLILQMPEEAQYVDQK